MYDPIPSFQNSRSSAYDAALPGKDTDDTL
jgi:hypothetical protein